MEVIAAIPIILVPFFFPLTAGWMAMNFGRKFWPWFILGLILPFIAHVILLCLPIRKKPVAPARNTELSPVPNEEIFDHLITDEKITNKKDEHEIYFSASA